MEVRIYYGSLEQANHFVKPIIDSIKGAMPVLVKLKPKTVVKNQIHGILAWKNPDILITCVDRDRETVLFMVEFSTAAYTKDHELQRFDNYIPLIDQNFIHVKISSKKVSSSKSGGQVNFDQNLPYVLLWKHLGKIAYVFEWPSNNDMVKVNEDYLSCPQTIDEFEDLVKIGVQCWMNSPKTWIESTNKLFESHNKLVKKYNGLVVENITKLDSKRNDYYANHPMTNSSTLVFKINRFGHAMDPDCGMLVYYGMLADFTGVCKSIIVKFKMSDKSGTWYEKAGRSTEKQISEYIRNNGLNTPEDFARCFSIATKIDIKDEINKIKDGVLDLTDFVKNNYGDMSKPLRIIFGFSNIILLNDLDDNTILNIKFDRIKIEGSMELSYEPTPLTDTEYTEDELTYIIVHSVLKDNGYRMISVSYPAAQGNRVILVQPSTGRRQPREYIDIVAYKSNILSMTENKQNPKELYDDIKKLKKYRRPETAGVISTFVAKYVSHGRSMEFRNNSCVKIGVGFFTQLKSTHRDLPKNFEKLDYFISVNKDKASWKICHYDKVAFFEKTEGAYTLPETRMIA